MAAPAFGDGHVVTIDSLSGEQATFKQMPKGMRKDPDNSNPIKSQLHHTSAPIELRTYQGFKIELR